MLRVPPLLFGLLILGSACSRPASAEAKATPAPAVVAPSPGGDLYQGLLRDHVREGRVDYAALRTDARLAAYLKKLAARDPSALPRDEALAYWINAYNAATLKLVVDAWPVDSIMKINAGKPWDVPVFRPRGQPAALTLNQIEHDIIRKQFAEPRIHFALVCAAASCPPLRAEEYTASALEAQLAEQTKNFLADRVINRFDPATNRYVVSPLFKWYASDFGGTDATVRAFIDDLAGASPSADAPITYSDYDWSLNAVKR